MPMKMDTFGDIRAQRGYNNLRIKDVRIAKLHDDTQ